jgi:CRP-like cAMP-binding protein
MQTSILIDFLSGITDLSPEFLDALTRKLKEEKYKPHQIIHAAGHLENRLYFIVSGFIRNYYFDHKGAEHTVKFWEPGDVLFSYEGYYNVQSYFYTEVIKAGVLISLSYADLHELDLQFQEIAILIKSVLLRYQEEEYWRQNLIILTAEERYVLLRETKPKFFNRASIKLIASYLQMSRETLTRFIGKL